MKRRTFISAIIATTVIGVGLLPNVGFAAKSQIYSNSSTGIAINGYDPVAYFTENKPVECSADISALWKGTKWHFSSDKNRQRFLAMPDKYAPQYGGCCAFAVSYGSTATTVPEAWSIVDGKLYLNNSLGVRSRWNTDIRGYIAKANKNWPNVLK